MHFFVFVERIWRIVQVKLISDPHLDMHQQQYFDNSVSTFVKKKKWNFLCMTLKLQLKWLLKAPLLASQHPLLLASFLLLPCPFPLLSCGMLILELTCQLLTRYEWLWRLFLPRSTSRLLHNLKLCFLKELLTTSHSSALKISRLVCFFT